MTKWEIMWLCNVCMDHKLRLNIKMNDVKQFILIVFMYRSLSVIKYVEIFAVFVFSCFCGDHNGNPLPEHVSFPPGANNPTNVDCGK